MSLRRGERQESVTRATEAASSAQVLPGARRRQAGSWQREGERRKRRKRSKRRRGKEAGAAEERQSTRGRGALSLGGLPAHRHLRPVTVSPQHPCEVGWKAATVTPTSQMRASQRGRWSGERDQSPAPATATASPEQRQTRDSHSDTGEDGGLQNKGNQKNKTQKKVMRGRGPRRFLPTQPDSECEWPGRPQAAAATRALPTSQFRSSTVASVRISPQPRCVQRAGRTRMLFRPPPHPARFPAPGRSRCGGHQGHTPQGKGLPALPTKAGWTVAGGWKENGGGGGWQFPLACCWPCGVGVGGGPPGPGVCP